MGKTISHKGIVREVLHDSIEIMILSEAACASCKSKDLCGVSEAKDKIITVSGPQEFFEPGEEVNVVMSQSLGTTAVLFAYVFPFVIMILSLTAGYFSGLSEPLNGLMVVILLAAYFMTLYAFRKKLNKKFSFTIKKL